MRWKVHFCNKEEVNEIPENYGLKSVNCPPQINKLPAFENELFNSLNISKFRKVQRAFQGKLKEDIQLINSEIKTPTFANKTKTTNRYKLEKEEYNKLLKDSNTTTYKKVKQKNQLRRKKHCNRQNY